MNKLDSLIAHQLPGNATQISRRINREYSSTMRALKRMVENGDVFREDNIYSWHPAKPLPEKPAVKLAEEEVWVKTFRLWHRELQKEAVDIVGKLTMDELLEGMNKSDNRLSIAIFIETINAIEQGQN